MPIVRRNGSSTSGGGTTAGEDTGHGLCSGHGFFEKTGAERQQIAETRSQMSVGGKRREELKIFDWIQKTLKRDLDQVWAVRDLMLGEQLYRQKTKGPQQKHLLVGRHKQQERAGGLLAAGLCCQMLRCDRAGLAGADAQRGHREAALDGVAGKAGPGIAPAGPPA